MYSMYYNIYIAYSIVYSTLGNDRKSLRTFAPAGYQVFWKYSPRQIPVPICLDKQSLSHALNVVISSPSDSL